MSVAAIDHSIDHTIDESAAKGHDAGVVDISQWLDHTASLRRSFTGYVPRHRADGPAV
jgi:hypothetical protein